ncbi:MAG: hypothetical protein AAGB12_06235 [Pseudomonadota bacterium]
MTIEKQELLISHLDSAFVANEAINNKIAALKNHGYCDFQKDIVAEYREEETLVVFRLRYHVPSISGEGRAS